MKPTRGVEGEASGEGSGVEEIVLKVRQELGKC